MRDVLKKSALWSQLGLAVVALLVGACGDDSNSKSSKCEGDAVYASVGGVTDCYDRCSEGVCGVGERCDVANNICIPTVGNNTTVNNTSSNNTSSNNTSDNNTSGNNTSSNNTSSNNTTSNNTSSNNTSSNNTSSNNTSSNNTTDAALEALCAQACDLLYGSCITNNCTLAPEDVQTLSQIEASCLSGGTSGVSCAQEAAADPQVRSALEQLAQQTCDDVKALRCGEFGLTNECGCATPTNLGAACTQDTQCNGGDLDGFCIPAVDENGAPTAWEGGYCVATPCPIPDGEPPFSYKAPACGTNGVCSVVGTPGDEFAFCRAACGTSCTSRAGYACQIIDLDVTETNDVLFLTACLPECTADADCGTTSRCNLTTGSCELQCSTEPLGGQAGNPSLADVCVASGGTCQGTVGSQYCVL